MLNICPDIFDSLWYMNIKSGGWEGGKNWHLTMNDFYFIIQRRQNLGFKQGKVLIFHE